MYLETMNLYISHGVREFRAFVSIQFYYWSLSNIRPFLIVPSSNVHFQCERECILLRGVRFG
jgi:hypothetical protein